MGSSKNKLSRTQARVPEQRIEHKDLGEPFRAKETVVIEPADFLASQRPYPVDRADYLTLRFPTSGVETVGYAFVVLSLGSIVNLTAKWFDAVTSGSSFKVPTLDYWVAGIPFVLGLVMILLGRLLPNERRKLLKRMNKHFSDNPRFDGVVRKRAT